MSDSSTTPDDRLAPRYPLADGTGTPLGQLPCFRVVSLRRNSASVALEAALEPLHRLLYGRAGLTGERRAALEDFKGFPPAARATIEERVSTFTKDRLRQLITAFGIRQPVSRPVAELAAAVVDFLMAPRDDGVLQPCDAATPKRSRSRSATDTPKKTTSRKLKEPRADGSGVDRQQERGAGPSEAAVKVAVFERVLRMSPEERSTLSAKALRKEIETSFHLPEGGLEDFKDAIVTAAALVVRSLVEAEQRASPAGPSA